MDLTYIIRFTVCTVLGSLLLGKCSSTPLGWLERSIRSANQNVKDNQKIQANTNDGELVPSETINSRRSSSGSETVDTSCCLNGGICIMNAFCHCKKNFYGRYCEHRVRRRSCGTIRHGTWMASGCHLCHCFDGQMRCKVTKIAGCENLSYIESVEKDPDYLVGIDSKFGEYDAFYDVSDDVTGATSGSGTTMLYTTMLLMSFVLALASIS